MRELGVPPTINFDIEPSVAAPVFGSCPVPTIVSAPSFDESQKPPHCLVVELHDHQSL